MEGPGGTFASAFAAGDGGHIDVAIGRVGAFREGAARRATLERRRGQLRGRQERAGKTRAGEHALLGKPVWRWRRWTRGEGGGWQER